jgi:hypothetical protein
MGLKKVVVNQRVRDEWLEWSKDYPNNSWHYIYLNESPCRVCGRETVHKIHCISNKFRLPIICREEGRALVEIMQEMLEELREL